MTTYHSLHSIPANDTTTTTTTDTTTARSGRRRTTLVLLAYGFGLGTPALCWMLSLCANVHTIFGIGTDKYSTLAVCASIYAPLLAFVHNPGEPGRSRRKQISHFAWLWFLSNTGYQLCWELPWFLLKHRLQDGGVTAHDGWLWPWWAYGNADSRYLSHNDLTLAISGMDAAIALSEVVGCYLYLKGYRIMWCWFDVTIGACLGWGQYYFNLGMIYNDFNQIHDGWFGLAVKLGIMNVPWLVFPFVSCAGCMWNLAYYYKQKGVHDYLQQQQQGSGVCDHDDFGRQVDGFMKVHNDGRIACGGDDELDDDEHKLLRRLLTFIIVWPFVFLIIDMTVYLSRYR